MAENSYTVEQSTNTPLINFDAQSGIFELKGKSIPENPVQYYIPLFNWLDNYIQNPFPQTILNIQLDYFNTSSAKCIVDLFKKLEQISKNGKGETTINWLYNEQDEDMLEAGEDYKSIIKIPFNLVSFIK